MLIFNIMMELDLLSFGQDVHIIMIQICIGSLELNKRTKDLTNQIAVEEAVLRRSTRVRAPPRENPATAYLRYVNRWKED